MSKKISHFPYPQRNLKISDYEIFYDAFKKEDYQYVNHCYRKNTSTSSISIANQFFSIENILLDAFQYVLPVESNANTCSVKFATVIRESCNLFEIISRKLYIQFFEVDTNSKLDIYNFLSLDHFLNLSRIELRAPVLECYHAKGEKIEPYLSLQSWNRNEALKSEHIPKWWSAYNKIKHDIDSLCNHATLENAIYSLSALFLLIKIVYGDGLICGFLRKKENALSHTILYQIKKSDIFFGEILKTQK
ncbi:MAG: hypothetical protein ABL929_12660 [Ferruginibacter sp.]